MRRSSILHAARVCLVWTIVALMTIDVSAACGMFGPRVHYSYCAPVIICPPVRYCPPVPCEVIIHSGSYDDGCGQIVGPIVDHGTTIHDGGSIVAEEAVPVPGDADEAPLMPEDEPAADEDLPPMDDDDDLPSLDEDDDLPALDEDDDLPALDDDIGLEEDTGLDLDDDTGLEDFGDEPGLDEADVPADDDLPLDFGDDAPADAADDTGFDLLDEDDAGAMPEDAVDDAIDFDEPAADDDTGLEGLLNEADVDTETVPTAEEATDDGLEGLFDEEAVEEIDAPTDDLDSLLNLDKQPQPQRTVLTRHNLGTVITKPILLETRLPMRSWVDNTGRFNTVARLVEVGPGHVRLFKENGRFATVSLRRLSDNDMNYVLSQAEELLLSNRLATNR